MSAPPAIGLVIANWRAAYIAHMVGRGVDPEFAAATFEAGSDDHDYSQPASEAADNEMSYWGD